MQELKIDGSGGNSAPGSAAEPPSKPKFTSRQKIKPKSVSFFDSMKFGGPAPEIINGRLAMIGFVTAVYNEVTTGTTIEQQVLSNPFPAAVLFVALTYATLVPIMKGCKNEAFGAPSPPLDSFPHIIFLTSLTYVSSLSRPARFNPKPMAYIPFRLD
jgi:hypothetical protein